jgi:hypothetical protein
MKNAVLIRGGPQRSVVENVRHVQPDFAHVLPIPTGAILHPDVLGIGHGFEFKPMHMRFWVKPLTLHDWLKGTGDRVHWNLAGNTGVTPLAAAVRTSSITLANGTQGRFAQRSH